MKTRTLYTDWGDSREFTIGDMGVGECAGEIVSHAEFGLAAAERQVFEAQVFLDENPYQKAGETAYASMLQAAKTLVEEQFYQCARMTRTGSWRNSARASMTRNSSGMNMQVASLDITSCVPMKKQTNLTRPKKRIAVWKRHNW